MKLSPEEIAARLDEVRRSYIASLQDKHDVMVTTWSALCSQWDPESFQILYRILHSLAGSAETFGLVDISRDARRLVERLRPHDSQQPLPSETMPVVQAELERLQAEMKMHLAALKKT